MARQSAKDQAERLSKGCCPIHGIDMPQIGLVDDGSEQHWLVECPRRDCEMKGTSVEPSGPVDLLPECKAQIERRYRSRGG